MRVDGLIFDAKVTKLSEERMISRSSKQSETDCSMSKVQSTIEIDFWTGMKLLGVMRTGKQIRTHFVTGTLLLVFGVLTMVMSQFEPILVFSLPVSGTVILLFCIYCMVARDIKFNFIVSICTCLVSYSLQGIIGTFSRAFPDNKL